MHLALSVLNPALLWGLPLVAAPIIIHLLNRRRYDRRRWAAMELLRRAIEQNRRRLRMEQWLVLLLRTLAVLALCLLVTRPSFDSVSFTGEVHRIVVLDDSRSTSARVASGSVFDRSREAVQALARSLSDRSPSDRLTLIRSSEPRAPLLSGVPCGPDLVGRVTEALQTAGPRPGGYGLGDVLASVDERREEASIAVAELIFITDLRRNDWLDSDDEVPEVLRDWLNEDQVSMRLVDVGESVDQNLSIVSLRTVDRRAVAGVPIRLAVELQNRGTKAFGGGPLTVEIDGRTASTEKVSGLRPGERTTIELRPRFADPGSHGVTTRIGGDLYAADDQRSLVLELGDETSVLIVDGDPDEKSDRSESYLLANALDITTESVDTSVGLTIVDAEQWATLDAESLAQYDAIYFCDVARFGEESVARLEAFVATGGGVVLFTGDQTDPAVLSQALWRDGTGVLPAQPVRTDGDTEDPRSLTLTDPIHPMFEEDPDLWWDVFGKLVKVGRWTSFALPEDDEARAEIEIPLFLAPIANEDTDPFLFGRTSPGGGSVWVCASSADPRWNNLGARAGLLLIAQETLARVARDRSRTGSTLSPYDRLSIDIDLARFRREIAIEPLDDASLGRSFTATPSEDGRSAALEIEAAELPIDGLHALRLDGHDGEPSLRYVARNASNRESNLTRITPAELLGALPEESVDKVAIVGNDDVASSSNAGFASSLWRFLAWFAIAALLLETFLASRRGRS